MKKKMFIGIIGGISIIATSISIYNYYRLPVIRHKEIIDKVYGIYKWLKKWKNNLFIKWVFRKGVKY